MIGTWEKNDIGGNRAICNRAIRRAKGEETKTLSSEFSVFPDIFDNILHSKK